MKPFRLWIFNTLTRYLPETRFWGLKVSLLRWCGAVIGQNVRIVSGAMVVGNGHLTIGDDVFIGAGCRISPIAPAKVVIGSHVDLAPQVMVLTGTHEIDLNGDHIAGRGRTATVKIGDGCWLGARSIILPGVTLQEKTLVAAGAVVTRSVSQGCCLVAGIPAGVEKVYSE